MNVLFYLPDRMLRRCFSPADLAGIQAAQQVTLPGTDDAAGLARRFAEHAPTAEVLVTGWGTPPLTDALLDQAPRLRALLHSAGSVRHLLPASFWSRGIRLGTANGPLAVGVAETTLAMIIAGLKGFWPCQALARAGGWHTDAVGKVREPYEITIGLIGASQVGRHVIRLLQGLEVRVLLTDPYVSEAEAVELGVTKVELEQLLRDSEVVSLHAPALEQTRHMLGAKQFALMKDGAIFINTARGMIVDEAALVAELERGRLFAFIDVTDPEPPAADHPFRRLPNVVLTPHIAGGVGNGCFRQGRQVVQQIAALAAGTAMPGEVTAAMAPIMA